MPVSEHTTLSEIVLTCWPVLLVSFLVSLVMTPVFRKLALAKNIVDQPDGWLKSHRAPIPYCGGVAILLGWLAGVGLAILFFRDAQDPAVSVGGSPSLDRTMMLGVLAAGAAITLLGLIDDIRSISPLVKLAVNIGIAMVIVWLGAGDDIVRVFTGSAGVRFEDTEGWLILAYSWPVSIFIIVGACNATNLIDGLDGLCSGVLGIISLGFLILAVHMHTYSDWGHKDVERVVLSLALLGSAFGFLPFNRNPARIFMGDAGSMLLGLNAAVLLLLFGEAQRIKWMLGSLMVFGLPICDMLLTLIRRWRAQRPLTLGDRSHFYDQLLDRGFGVRAVVRISYVLAGVFVVLGILPTVMRTRHLILVYAVFLTLVVYVIYRLKLVRVDSPPGAFDYGDVAHGEP